MSLETKRPFNALAYAAADVSVTRRANGEVILQSTHALPAFPRCVGDWLDYWAECAPERVFMAERRAAGWRTLTYGQALVAVRSLGCALLARGLSVSRPVAILSDNSVDHALLSYACQYVVIPVAPISQAYSLMSKDYAKLKAIFALLEPGLVYVGHEARFSAPIASLADFDFELLASRPAGRAPTAVRFTLMKENRRPD